MGIGPGGFALSLCADPDAPILRLASGSSRNLKSSRCAAIMMRATEAAKSAPTSTRDEPHVGTHICGENPKSALVRYLEFLERSRTMSLLPAFAPSVTAEIKGSDKQSSQITGFRRKSEIFW